MIRARWLPAVLALILLSACAAGEAGTEGPVLWFCAGAVFLESFQNRLIVS